MGPGAKGASSGIGGHSSAVPRVVGAARRGADGAPVYGYRREPGLPPISLVRVGPHAPPPRAPRSTAHAHDFLVLAFFDQGGGRLSVDGVGWPVEDGDAVVVAPGEVVGPEWTGDVAGATAWVLFFPADAVDERAGVGVSWRAHPLLFPFVGSRAGGVQRLRVPAEQRTAWAQRFADLDRELRLREDGFPEAAQALLTLLLVGLARLAADVPGHLRAADGPSLAAVFDVVERRFGEPISLRDVADEVGLSAGHLTTVVRRRTGRTVQQWITERRMTEARRLLGDPELTVASISGQVGYRDPGYFVRRFRAAHGVTPQEWRRAARPL
jgi:AraC family transcriptional regulator, transcriptional activator of pobA